MLSAFEPDVDLVLGSRFLGGFQAGAITRLNYAGTKVITGTVNVLFGTHITDPLAGFRAVRSSVFNRVQIEARGYDIEVDVLAARSQLGGRVVEVPAQRCRTLLRSQRPVERLDGLRIFKRIVQIRFLGPRVPSTAPPPLASRGWGPSWPPLLVAAARPDRGFSVTAAPLCASRRWA
jgi:hypothetical protein